MNTQAQAPLQVLYIEDDATNALLMQALFRLRPHLALKVAADGHEATQMAPQLAPSLLLLDLRLPDCFGSELLPLLRRRFHWERVPAVAVTSEAEFRCEGSSFAEVWTKPLDLHRVLDRLDHWLPPDGTPLTVDSPLLPTRVPLA